MIFVNDRDLSSQVVAIPMAFLGRLMYSPDSEFQRISPQNAHITSFVVDAREARPQKSFFV
jgi:hypothetical protein